MVLTELKFQPAFSVCQSSLALAALTYEMPTLAWMTCEAVVSKVRNAALGLVCPDGVITCEAVNEWSKVMSKYTVYGCGSPQKPPLVSEPMISLVPTTWALLAESPFWLSISLTMKSA